ncbi:helix-turn-helix transcriptional regulator [Companilactobacillus sp. DQM5]|uniref:helix-turn-helix transcriptional regulator n=1 Tax=Companilactobacillus sp. DQM5 TaxID=3463359 RepID=UPI0040589F77
MKNNIKFLREEHNLSRQDLAKLMNVSTATITYWEQNKRQPRVDKAERLAKILHATVPYLTGVTDYIPYIEEYKDYKSNLSNANNIEIRHTILSEDEYDILDNIHYLNESQLKEIKNTVLKYKKENNE